MAYSVHISAGHLIKIENIFYMPSAAWPSAANNLIKISFDFPQHENGQPILAAAVAVAAKRRPFVIRFWPQALGCLQCFWSKRDRSKWHAMLLRLLLHFQH